MIDYKHIAQVAADTKQHIQDRKDGKILSIKTPWKKINENNLGGFQWSDLIIWAGLSGSGKTAAVGQLIRELHNLNHEQDFIILFFTFEMPGYKVLLRDLIADTKVARKYLLSADGNIINDNQQNATNIYLDMVSNKNIYFIEKSCKIEEYIELCNYFHNKTGKKIFAIADHSLLFKGKKNSDERGTLVDISESLVELKNEGWSSHFLVSQLNREIESSVRRNPCSPLNIPDKSCLFGSKFGTLLKISYIYSLN